MCNVPTSHGSDIIRLATSHSDALVGQLLTFIAFQKTSGGIAGGKVELKQGLQEADEDKHAENLHVEGLSPVHITSAFTAIKGTRRSSSWRIRNSCKLHE